MTEDERARIALHRRLDEVLGPEHAVTLLARLPDPSAPLATRMDTDALGARIDRLEHRMDRLEDRVDGLQRELNLLSRWFALAVIIGSVVASSTIAFVAATLV